MIGDVHHGGDLGDSTPNGALDSLAERDGSHAATLAASRKTQVGRPLLHGYQVGPAPVGGDTGVHVAVEGGDDPLSHLSREIGRRVCRGGGRAVGVDDHHSRLVALAGHVESGAPQLVGAGRGNDHRQAVVILLDDIVGPSIGHGLEVHVVGVVGPCRATHLQPEGQGLATLLLGLGTEHHGSGGIADPEHRLSVGDLLGAHVPPRLLVACMSLGCPDLVEAPPEHRGCDPGNKRCPLGIAPTRHDRRMARIVLLLPTATYRAAAFLAAATELGAEVVVACERRQALAKAMGDRALVINLDKPQAAAETIVELGRRLPVDAVVAVDDQGVLTAALASAALGLAHNPPEAVLATRDKAALRSRLAAAGIAQPDWRVAGPEVIDDQVVRLCDEVGLPCVLKPVSLAASRGVIRVDAASSVPATAARVRAIAAEAKASSATLLVERYVPGREVAVEGLLRRGRLDVLAMFDKPDPLEGPYFEETIYITPSRLPTDLQHRITRLTGAACAALGLVEGPVHAEVRTDGEALWLIEVAARTIGGLCSRALVLGAGISLEHLVVAHALGVEDRGLEDRGGLDRGGLGPSQAASGVMMLPIPVGGVLEGVDNLHRAREVPGVTDLEISIVPGRRVRPLPEGDRYLGFIFARANTPEEVEAALRGAHNTLDIRIKPDELTGPGSPKPSVT